MEAHSTLLTSANNHWLSSLPQQVADELIKLGKVRKYGKGQNVHTKGESTDALYCVLRGEVRISASTLTGDELILTRMLPGQWFGEIALLDGGARTHDAYAVGDAEILVIPGKPILALCQRMPALYNALVHLVCAHCRLAFAAMDELLIYTPEQRLAKRLVQRRVETGELSIHISQQEMGALVGISRQSINKILKSWQDKQWIIRIYGGITLTDESALSRIF